MLSATGSMMHAGLSFTYPGYAAMALKLKSAIICLMVGVPYYFSAVFAFFLSPENHEHLDEGKGLILAGRRFCIDANFLNPANHLLAATIAIFSGLGIFFY
ncbi:MAG: hypothetical protein ACOYXC_01515 [Candidatus Rifleibacteriota bacterium]